MIGFLRQRVDVNQQIIKLNPGFDPLRIFIFILFFFIPIYSSIAYLIRIPIKNLFFYLLFLIFFVQIAGYIKILVHYRKHNYISEPSKFDTYGYLFLILIPFILFVIANSIYLPIMHSFINSGSVYNLKQNTFIFLFILFGSYALTVPIETVIDIHRKEIKYRVKFLSFSGFSKTIKFLKLTNLYCFLDHGDAEGGYLPYHYLIGIDKDNSKSYTLIYRFSFTHKKLKENTKMIADHLGIPFDIKEIFDGEDFNT